MSLDIELCDPNNPYDVYTYFNITHNLTEMAAVAGLYKLIWRPEEIGIFTARQLIEPLSAGLRRLKDMPEFFSLFDSPNFYGTYVDFVAFVGSYLEACKALPDAEIRASR